MSITATSLKLVYNPGIQIFWYSTDTKVHLKATRAYLLELGKAHCKSSSLNICRTSTGICTMPSLLVEQLSQWKSAFANKQYIPSGKKLEHHGSLQKQATPQAVTLLSTWHIISIRAETIWILGKKVSVNLIHRDGSEKSTGNKAEMKERKKTTLHLQNTHQIRVVYLRSFSLVSVLFSAPSLTWNQVLQKLTVLFSRVSKPISN